MTRSAKPLEDHGEPRQEQDHTITLICPAVKLILQLSKEVKALSAQLRERGTICDDILDNADLLKEFKISKSTACNWRAAGLSYIKKGGKLYYYRADIKQFLSRYQRKGF
jgi:hypothetical protein